MTTSVIIPCWNALELTRVCLKQLVRRTTRPYELIVVDNGSRDGTGAWLESFRSDALRSRPRGTLRRFHVISNKWNLGYPAAMNQGIRAARGAFVLFGNSDAAVTPLWLENMQAALRSAPAVGGVSASGNPPRAPGSAVAWGCPPAYRGIKGLERYASAALLGGRRPVFCPAEGFFTGHWFLMRRAVLETVGGFDEGFGQGGFEDFDLQWRLRRAGYALGFAGRAYVHHVGFGCAQKNGLRFREFYAPGRRALLSRKYPETAAVAYSECPLWAAS